MAKEEDRLLPAKTMSEKWLPCRLFVVILVVSCSYFSIWMLVYASSEWMQDKVKREIFSNGSETLNSSKCGAVNKSDPVFKDHQRVQQITAKWQMYNTMATKAVSLLPTVVLAVYTDVLGRRFMFILSTFSIFLNFIMTALIIYYDMDLEYLVGANAIYGLTGTSYGLLSVSYSAVADITPDRKERSFGIFLLDISIGIAGTLGSLLVGFYIQHYGFIYPAFTGTGIQVCVVLFTMFFVNESLQVTDRIKAPPIQSILLRPFVFYANSDFKGSRLLFITLLFAFVFTDMTGVHRRTMETLYQLAEPFCWSSSRIGVYALIFSLGENVIGLASFKALQTLFTDITIAMMSVITNAASFVIEGLATNSLMLFIAAVPAVLNSLSSPLIRGTMSKMTSRNQQGALFASILVVQTIASFLTGISDNAIYAATLTIFNGLFFFVLAGYCIICFLFLLLFRLLLKYTTSGHVFRAVLNGEEKQSDVTQTSVNSGEVKQTERNIVVNSDENQNGVIQISEESVVKQQNDKGTTVNSDETQYGTTRLTEKCGEKTHKTYMSVTDNDKTLHHSCNTPNGEEKLIVDIHIAISSDETRREDTLVDITSDDVDS